MIALDTNILVYAHREDSPHHTAALRVIQELTRRECSASPGPASLSSWR